MLRKAYQALVSHRGLTRFRLRMFHRAATSAPTQTRSQHSTSQPFKLSQPCVSEQRLNAPLSPKKNSHVNAGASLFTESKPKITANMNQKHVLLSAIKDTASSKYNATMSNSNENTAVYFNEDDFDDDLDFSFDSVAHKPAKKHCEASSPISWPPSSYLIPSPVSKKTDPLQKGSVANDGCSQASGSERAQNSMPSPSPARKPRTLPWQREDSIQSRQYGPSVSQTRSASNSAAVKEDESELEHVLAETIIPKQDPYNITGSAVKAAIKGRGKKRAADELDTSTMHSSVQKAAMGNEVAKVFLSAEQRGVIDLLKTGKSVFFTGSAGTGKSVLLRTAIQELRLQHKQLEKVAVTASTGLAACNIGGVTLHSFAGVGLGRDSVAEMVKKVKRNKKNVLKWTKTKVLIIDEISMVDADFFDKLEAVARQLRGNQKPWGGMQLVATGDFFQLPPVPDNGKVAKFAFEAEKWKALDATIQLTTVFRQKDEKFVQMLNQMRTGSLTEKTIRSFKQLERPLLHDDGIIPTELFPTRNEVDNANAARMRHLPGNVHVFDAEDSGSITDIQQRTKLLSNCMAPPRLELKKGAQVMLIKNRDDGLVNGSLGVVIGFMNEKTYTYASEGGEEPLDESILRDSPWTLEELAVMDQTPAGKRKLLKLRQMEATAATQKVWPLVRFKSPNGGQDMTQLMSPESWKIEQPNGDVQACRKQVPLILAYAISIHKAQGQTIERVKVDLGKVFEKGQAYVALSRAVSQEGLQVLRFDVKRVMAHPKVAAFYRELVDANVAIEHHNSSTNGVKMERTTSAARSLTEDESFQDSVMTTQEVFSQIKREPIKAFKHVSRR